LRVAINSELRKLSAWAAVRKPSFQSLLLTFQRTLYVVTRLPLYLRPPFVERAAADAEIGTHVCDRELV
jgi:hypothetical protein